jgi:hypothetical protein
MVFGGSILKGVGGKIMGALGSRGAARVVESAAFDGIGATGKLGEDTLVKLGGDSQVFFRTSQGGRYVDQLVDGMAHEAKVGRTSLTSRIASQISKDAELIQTGQINSTT